MSHLVIHLVDELEICGPVACRWMYPIERYMGVLKKYVHNRSLLEGSMAEGYIVEEALGLCTEFFQNYQHVRTRMWDADEEPGVIGIELEGRGSARRLTDGELRAAHLHVVTNSVATESYYRDWLHTREMIEEGRVAYRASHRRRGRYRMSYPPSLAAVGDFLSWLREKVRGEMVEGVELSPELTTLPFPPSPQILTFCSCKAFGNHYRVVTGDEDTGHTTFDSGIALIAEQGSRTSTADRNMKAVLSYVGVLREIIQLMYDQTPVIMFRGSWVPPQENGNASIKRDKYGFWLANFNRRQRASEQPYAFPDQVRQVFFSDDPHDAGWKVVLQKDSRSTRVERPGDGVVLGAAPVNEELDVERHVRGGSGNGHGC